MNQSHIRVAIALALFCTMPSGLGAAQQSAILELYVQAGFTPMEAIQASTIVPARVMGFDEELGTVEKGK